MRIALLAPLPPEKNGIADYANHFRTALEQLGVTVLTPLAGVAGNSEAIKQAIGGFDWQSVDLVHAELGGGRLGEFLALRELLERGSQNGRIAGVDFNDTVKCRLRIGKFFTQHNFSRCSQIKTNRQY